MLINILNWSLTSACPELGHTAEYCCHWYAEAFRENHQKLCSADYFTEDFQEGMEIPDVCTKHLMKP